MNVAETSAATLTLPTAFNRLKNVTSIRF